MRTTVTLDDHLLGEAKVIAARRGSSLSSVLEDALREMLARHRAASEQPEVRLPVYGKANDAFLVDILDKDALAAAFEERDRDALESA